MCIPVLSPRYHYDGVSIYDDPRKQDGHVSILALCVEPAFKKVSSRRFPSLYFLHPMLLSLFSCEKKRLKRFALSS